MVVIGLLTLPGLAPVAGQSQQSDDHHGGDQQCAAQRRLIPQKPPESGQPAVLQGGFGEIRLVAGEPVAEFFQPQLDLAAIDLATNLHLLGRETDMHLFHTGKLADAVFDRQCTAAAVHAFDAQALGAAAGRFLFSDVAHGPTCCIAQT